MNIPFEFGAFVDRLASDAGQRLSLALVHFLWQGVLIAAAAALLMRLVGRKSSQRRYLIGVVAMSAMAVAPIVTFCLVEPPDWSRFIVEDASDFDLSGMETADLELLLATLEIDAHSSHALPELPPRPLTWPERIRLYQPYALLLWLCGTGLFALRLGIGLHATWRFGRKRTALPDAWHVIAQRAASRLGVALPRIYVSERVVEAVAVGLLKPMVLLPAAWIGNVPPDVLEAVLAHEIAHLRRYDLWVNLLQRCVEAALFYHPAVWWLSRRIRQEREFCCDELAATAVSGRAAYARALEYVATERVANTGRASFAAALAAGMGGSKMALLDRVRRVLGNDVKPNRGTWLSEGLLALAVPAALWAGIATVAPSIATADDAETTQQNDEAASADAHIGDAEYWKERGVEPGMITVLEDGELVDLATGERVEHAHSGVRGGFSSDSERAEAMLREMREELQRLRRDVEQMRRNGRPGQFIREPAAKSVKTMTDEEARISKQLDRTISLNLKDVPLEKAISEIKNAAEVNIVLDAQGLDEEGLTPTTPVSCDLQNVPVRAALMVLLSPLNLSFVIDNDVLNITSRLRSQGPLTLETYVVADLVQPRTIWRAGAAHEGLTVEPRDVPLETLADLITSTIEPGSWEYVGGNGVIRPNAATLSLVVRQTEPVHEQIADLLEQLRNLQIDDFHRGIEEAVRRAKENPINRTHKSPIGISSNEKVEQADPAPNSQKVVVYSVARLAKRHAALSSHDESADAGYAGQGEWLNRLVEHIKATIEPETWHAPGREESIQSDPASLSLIVMQRERVHDLLRKYLDQLEWMPDEVVQRYFDRTEAQAEPINRTHKTPPSADAPRDTVENAVRRRKILDEQRELMEDQREAASDAVKPPRIATGPIAPKAPPAPRPPSATLPPAAGGVPAPAPLPPSPNASKVDHLLRVVPLEIDGQTVQVIVEELREGDGPAKEIQLRILKSAQPGETPEIKATLPHAADESAHEETEGPWEKGQWKLPPGASAPRGPVLSVQRFVPLTIDGENVIVIVEEHRGETDGPAKEIQLRILKPAEPGTPVYADPAEGEKAHRQAEEARDRADETREAAAAVDEAKELSPSELHDFQTQLQHVKARQEAERAFVESDRKLAALRALAEKTKNVMSPGHPKIREAEERLKDAEQEHERRLLLLRAIKAHPEASHEEITREIDALFEDREGKPATDEAGQRLQEMQRQLEEQQKVIEELRKNLDDRSRGAAPPDAPRNDADATANPDENASSTQSSTRSIFDEGLRLAVSVAGNIPAAIAASSKTFSFYVGFMR